MIKILSGVQPTAVGRIKIEYTPGPRVPVVLFTLLDPSVVHLTEERREQLKDKVRDALVTMGVPVDTANFAAYGASRIRVLDLARQQGLTMLGAFEWLDRIMPRNEQYDVYRSVEGEP